jgi:hypothetical protein
MPRIGDFHFCWKPVGVVLQCVTDFKQRIGRPRAVGPAELHELQRITGEGTTVTQAARILKISRSTAYAALREHEPVLATECD